MDPKNLRAIMLATEHWVKTDASLPAPADVAAKSSLMTAYCRTDSSKRYDCVPDPYYGGESGFELVLDLLQDASEGLLEHIQEQQRQAPLSAPQSAGAAGQQQQ
jgi:protein-tyrosine phosphatase